jgi:hypothetical protein
MDCINQKKNGRLKQGCGTIWRTFIAPAHNGGRVSSDPLLIFALRPVIGGLVGFFLHQFALSKSEISLDVLLGTAGGLVGGMIASFSELEAFGPFRDPFGASLGAIFFVLGWDQLRRRH